MDSWQTKLTLRELADRWGKDEGILLSMAADGLLRLSTHLVDKILELDGTKYTGFAGIRSEDAEIFRRVYEFELHESAPKNRPVKIHEVIGPDGKVFGLCQSVIIQRATSGNSWTGQPSRREAREFRRNLDINLFRSDLVVLKEEIERLEDLYPELSLRQKNGGELHPSERKSLLKMILGMAVGGYTYNPDQKKSNVPKEIADDVAKVDMSIDPDTVRKWLKEAANLPKEDW